MSIAYSERSRDYLLPPLAQDIDGPRDHHGNGHQRSEGLKHHQQLRPGRERQGVGWAERRRVGKRGVDVVEKVWCPSRCRARRRHLREEEIGPRVLWELPGGGSATIELPVPKAEHDDVRQPDRHRRVHEGTASCPGVVKQRMDQLCKRDHVGDRGERAQRTRFPILLSIRACDLPAHGLTTVLWTWLRCLRVSDSWTGRSGSCPRA